MGSPSYLLRTGRWEIDTSSSTYLLDLDQRCATRLPRADSGHRAGVPLRGDCQQVPLLSSAITVRPGQPMTLMLGIRTDGVPTVRTTTAVARVRPLTTRKEQPCPTP